MNDFQKLVLALCCLGALTTMSACSTTTSAEENDQTSTPNTFRSTRPSRPKPVTTVPKTTDTRDILPKATKTTLPETTIPAIPIPELPPSPVNVEVVGPWFGPIVGVGKADGADTANAQARLNQLGFWTGDEDGEYGFATTQAVMAFQKYTGLDPSGKLDQATADLLSVFPEKAHGTADDGTLVEVDKGKQLLFIIIDGKTAWAFNTSTGSEIPYSSTNRNTGEPESGDAVTPNGLWRVNRERPNGWWEGDLGDIYRPKYFRGGVAIHGMTRVPNQPVSHGCVRLSVAAMDFIWANDLVPLGTPVWVHE